MKTIHVIGLGSIGMRHARNLLDMGHTVCGYDPDADKAAKFMSAGGSGFAPSFDGVVIASPTHRHYFDITEALGDCPIFVEKPIADKLPDLPSTFTNVAMVGYNLRFHSCVKKAKEWLDAGLIGKPIWANFTLAQFNDRPDYLRDGVILNWSHELDLAYYLLGGCRVSASSTHRTDSGQDDLTDILLTHESGCRTTVHLDYTTEPEIREFTIAGTKGFLQAYLLTRRIYCSNGMSFSGSRSETWSGDYIEEMQAFCDRIDGKETIGCTGAEGLKVLEICLEVRKQAGLEPQTWNHVALGICSKCNHLHYSNEDCK